MKLKSTPLAYQPGHGTIWVIQVAEGQRSGRAGIHAGGSSFTVDSRPQTLSQTGINPLHAEIALLRRSYLMGIQFFTRLFKVGLTFAGEKAFVLVPGEKCPVLIGAGDNAVSAADALVLVNPDYPVGTLLGGPGGTYLDTGRFLALVASYRVC